MRLDKYISQVSDLSRTEVKRIIKTGVVTINQEVCTDPSRHVSDADSVCAEGESIAPPRPRYFMLNKPQGYVCVTKDRDHPTVLELLDEPNIDKLQIAGRLDIDTTGLVLITDDGKWNHAVTSPKRDCKKTYLVTTAHDITDDAGEQFSQGVMLEGEMKPTLPGFLEVLFANEAKLTISEGKYHQVKRMFGAIGNRVVELHREKVGDILLDEELEAGEYRELSDDEISSVKV